MFPFSETPDATYNGYKIWVESETEFDDDVTKAYHTVELPNGEKVSPPITPYDFSIHTVKLWIDACMPYPQYGNWDRQSLRQLVAHLNMGAGI